MTIALQQRRLIHLKVLACVARADGIVTDEEADFILLTLAGGALLEAEHEALVAIFQTESLNVASILAESAATQDADALAELLRDAYLLAGADHEIVPAEVATIDDLLAAAGVSAEARPALHAWGRHAATVQVDGLSLLTQALPPARGSLPSLP